MAQSNSNRKSNRTTAPNKLGADRLIAPSDKRKGFLNSVLPLWLQNINSILASLMTLVATILSFMAYRSAVEIKGMKEVLSGFSPYVQYHQVEYKFTNDSIYVYGSAKNFGTRYATNVKIHVFLVLPQYVHNFTRREVPIDFAQGQQYELWFNIRREKQFSNLDLTSAVLATKISFDDPIANRRDSTYTYNSRTTSLINETGIFKVTTKEEGETAKQRIRSDWPDENF